MGTGKLVRMTCGRAQREGFTLLELLVVVGILATLVALALPYYQDYINQSRITAAQADLTSYAKALALFEQTETTYTATTALPLIGKYVQDFRTYSGQTNPKDPWGNDYIINPMYGSIVCSGIDGVNDTVNDRLPQNDDMMATYKPPFFVSSARAINSTMVEVVFSRRIDNATVLANRFTVAGGAGGGAGTAFQRVSETVYRVSVAAMTGGPVARTVTVNAAVKDVTAMAIGTDLNPETGAAGNTATFRY